MFILCAMLGIRFCPRLGNFPDRSLADIEPATTHKFIQPLFGRHIRKDVIRSHWEGALRLVASLQAGISRGVGQSFASFGKNHPHRE